MNLSPALEQEWRQFQLLSRDSVRRLLDSIVFSRDTDPMLLALWGSALAMTPPFLLAVQKIIRYPFLIRAPIEVVERIVLADRLFFIIYGMLATALLAALMWDALFPDRTDQEIVGVLPVRPRTLASARLAAAVMVGATFAAVINTPAALIYSAASSVHPIVGSFPRVLVGHLAATTLACTFTFLGLMSLRAIVAVCAGEKAADRLAIGLQLVTIVLLVEVFLFLPSVLPSLVRQMQAGGVSYMALPPIWFAALFSWIAEGEGLLASQAELAMSATLVSILLVVAVSLPPAAWMGRRALETRARDRAAGLTTIARLAADVFVRAAAVRGMLLFSIASLARSRRHSLVLATYLGLAIATAILSLIVAGVRRTLTFDEPRAYLLALPLVFIFFAVYALRAACAIPTDLDANWPFRLAQPTVRAAVRATRLVFLGVGVVPITLLWLMVTLALWSPAIALRVTAFDLVAGAVLTEAALANWRKVPFATAHEPATATLKSRWPFFIVVLNVFGFRIADLQMEALRSQTATTLYLAIGVGIVIGLRVVRHWRFRRQTPTFDVVTNGIQTLNLSEALN